jgi:hypothetical protein
MSKPNRAADFLKAMQTTDAAEPSAPPPPAAVAAVPDAPVVSPPVAAVTVHAAPKPKAAKAKGPSRANLKHFGGYLDDETLEKIALLRVRLKKDNSQLIAFAIDELFRKHNAKRAFGDA